MNVGDKLICIKDYNNSGWLSKNDSLTKGQVYEVSEIAIGKLFIRLKDKGRVGYPVELFITLEQWRENQLNKILTAKQSARGTT